MIYYVRTFVRTALLGTLASSILLAQTQDEKAMRLEDRIEKASERGSFSLVLELRLQLAEHLESTGHYADAAREYQLLLATRPPKHERVRLFVQLGRMRD